MRRIRLRHGEECKTLDHSDWYTSIQMSCALIIALSLTLLVMLSVQIVTAKYSRTKFLNKLTLIPFYFCILFLLLLMFQVALIS